MTEVWRPVSNFPNYEVSDLGRVRSCGIVDRMGRTYPAKILTNARIVARYQRIRLRRDGVTHDLHVHVIVLEAFVCSRGAGMQACHNDGNTSNNTLSNLRWDTCSANQLDKRRHGTIARGERNGSHVLCARIAATVKLLAKDSSLGEHRIANLFGVSSPSVRAIRLGRTWSWLIPEPPQDWTIRKSEIDIYQRESRSARWRLAHGLVSTDIVAAKDAMLITSVRSLALAVTYREAQTGTEAG